MDPNTDTLTKPPIDAAPPPRGPRRRRRLVAGLLLASVVGAIVTALVFALGGGASTRSSLPSRPAPLDAAARELIALMMKGQEGVYHGRYRTAAASPTGATLSVEIWRRGERTRQDTVASDGTQTIHTAGFTLPSGDLACRLESGGGWRCVPVEGARTTTDELTRIATMELSGRSVSVRDETIAGRRVRCFSIVGEGQSSDICLTSDGIAVLVATGPTRLELVGLEMKVDDAVFRPPG